MCREFKHISYSEYKLYNDCPHKWRLLYRDKIIERKPSVHMSFGTAIHAAAEAQTLCGQLPAEEQKEIDFDLIFQQTFLEELKQLSAGDLKKNKSLIKQMREQGKPLYDNILGELKNKFKNYELIDTELLLYEPILEFEKDQYYFKGYIDLLIKTPDQKYHIIDYKTASRKWDWKKKKDKTLAAQLAFYKYFLFQKLDLDPKDIKTYFVVLNRTGDDEDHIEFVEKKFSGDLKKYVDNLIKTLHNITMDKTFKNRLSCNYCEVKGTEHCPFSISRKKSD